MSDLSHQGAFRLIYKRRLTRAEQDALQRHLRHCAECREDAEMAGLFSDHLVLEALPTWPSAQYTAVFMEGAARRSRRSHIMKPIYAVGVTVALALLMLAGWFIIRSNIQTTGLVEAPQLPAVSISESQPAAQPAAPEEVVSQPEIDMAAANEQLIEAVRSNDPAFVAKLLDAGADPDAVDSRGNAALAVAARSGKLEIARLLLDAGAEVDGTWTGTNGAQTSALYEAIHLQHNDVAELLIARGADVNWLWNDAKEVSGAPLHTASRFNNVEMVQRLIDNGADPNLRSKWSQGTTPLHWAVRNQSVEVARMLLSNGADVDLATDLGVTPLMYMLRTNAGSIRLSDRVTLLLEAGADLDLQDKIGDTALHYAARRGIEEAVALIIEHEASLDIENNAGQTPLDLAANDEIAEMLREAGATSGSQAETSPADERLLAAVIAGDAAEAEKLLNDGADPDFVSSDGYSALPSAAGAGQVEIVQLLLEAGADVNRTMDGSAPDGDPFTDASALLHAASHGELDVVELLLANGADPNKAETQEGDVPLHHAVWLPYGNIEIVNALLENGAKVDVRRTASDGMTPLHWAAIAGWPEATEALIQAGADINLQDLQHDRTPLHWVIYNAPASSQIEMMHLLLDAGADVNLASYGGVTPLMAAIRERFLIGLAEQVTLLLEAGADPDLQDDFGDAALHYAVRESKKEAVELLIEHGASLDIKNNQGHTPLDLATNDEIAVMLREAGAE